MHRTNSVWDEQFSLSVLVPKETLKRKRINGSTRMISTVITDDLHFPFNQVVPSRMPQCIKYIHKDRTKPYQWYESQTTAKIKLPLDIMSLGRHHSRSTTSPDSELYDTYILLLHNSAQCGRYWKPTLIQKRYLRSSWIGQINSCSLKCQTLDVTVGKPVVIYE